MSGNNSQQNGKQEYTAENEYANNDFMAAKETALPDQKSNKPVSNTQFRDAVHFLLAFCLVCGVLYYLIKTPTDTTSSATAHNTLDEQNDVVILPNGDIQLGNECSLFKRLQIETVSKIKTKDPLFEVSGNVLGSYRPEGVEYQWQFSSANLLSLYTDWQKSVNDVAFYTKQLASTKELAQTKTLALTKQFERKKKLVKIGTDTEQDLASTEAELLQVQIEERKNVYEAETELAVAKKTESSFARQLEQSGLTPKLLDSIAKDHDVIRANVPGNLFNKVTVGLECRASFLDFPGIDFTGTISEIIPVLSQEFGTLCVLFVVHDPKDFLRPGMFTDIGIGTEEREIIVVSPEAIIHIGESDFVLTRKNETIWTVRKVETGNLHAKGIEIRSGISQGDQVAGQGVILLKGYISEALALADSDRDKAKKIPEKSKSKDRAAQEKLPSTSVQGGGNK